jgi:hypothetical protein
MDLLGLLLQIVGFACSLGFIGWILNRFLGFSVGAKGVVVPTEWQAGLSFFLVGAACFGLAWLIDRRKKSGQKQV